MLKIIQLDIHIAELSTGQALVRESASEREQLISDSRKSSGRVVYKQVAVCDKQFNFHSYFTVTTS